jgi:hypothetical protein
MLLEARDAHGRNAAQIACQRGSRDVLEELLRSGARASAFSPLPLTSPPVPGRDPLNITVSELRALVPLDPVAASKPWNCLTQESIDGCLKLLDRIGVGWSRGNHHLFPPEDRQAIESDVLGAVLPALERRWGVYEDVWFLVLSWCDRGWFATR